VADKDAPAVAPAPADSSPIALPSAGLRLKSRGRQIHAKAAKLTLSSRVRGIPCARPSNCTPKLICPSWDRLVFESARLFRPQSQKAFCAPLCPTSDLNALDRTTAGYWSPGWQTASDYGLYAIGLGAATLLFVDEGLWPGLNDAVVIAESGLAATAAASVMTLAAGRPRPFLYGTKAPLSERNGADAGLSFLSSHAAVSFAIATSTLVAMRRLHPTRGQTGSCWALGARLRASWPQRGFSAACISLATWWVERSWIVAGVIIPRCTARRFQSYR